MNNLFTIGFDSSSLIKIDFSQRPKLHITYSVSKIIPTIFTEYEETLEILHKIQNWDKINVIVHFENPLRPCYGDPDEYTVNDLSKLKIYRLNMFLVNNTWKDQI